MQNIKLVAGALAIVLVGATVSIAQTADAKADKKADTEIRKALSDWVDATNRRDKAAANSIWEKNVVGWFPSVPEFGPGAAFAAAGLEPGKAPSYSTYDLKIDEIVVFGATASVYDVWTETRHFEGSKVTVTRIIRSSELWKRQSSGGWKIARWVSAPEKWSRDGQ